MRQSDLNAKNVNLKILQQETYSIAVLKNWIESLAWSYVSYGLGEKINLKSYWTTKSVNKTPLFTETVSRGRCLTILRYLHFVNNDNAPEPDDVNF